MKTRTFIIGIAVSLSIIGSSCTSHEGTGNEHNGRKSTSPTSTSDGRRMENHSSAAGPQESLVINIENYSFGQNEIAVAPGTRITWVNKDKVPHTVTANDKTFDSGILAKGSEFSHTFETPGTYAYHCIPHPAMKATVVVK